MKLWWLRLGGYARTEPSGLALLTVLMLIGIAFGMLGPWPMKLIVDYLLMGRPLPDSLSWAKTLPGAGTPAGMLGWLAAASVLLFLAQRALGLAQSYIQTGVGTRMVYCLGADLFDHVQRLSPSVHSRQSAGDLIRRITTDSSCVRNLVIGVFLPLLTSSVNVIAVFVVMWQLDRSLSLVALVAALPLPIVMKILTPKITERAYKKSQLQGQLMSHVEQTLTALPLVQAFDRERNGDKTFRTLSTDILQADTRMLSAQLQFKVAVTAPTAIGVAAMMVLGGLHVLEGSLTIGSLLVFLVYVQSLYTPLAGLTYLSSGYASASSSARRVLEILETDPGVRDTPGARPLPATRPRGNVRLESVTFGYEPERAVLQRIDLEARPGEVVALVGPTGAGKSTLVSLIPRFFDPWEGRVIVDGMDVRDVQLASLRAQVAIVLQDPFLLPLTIAENITYGRAHASRDEVVAAAVAANADEFIRRLPNGYQTVIGEKGVTLSGGEKQRLAIARALLKNAPILILDEPTSSLDAHTEALLLDALGRLMAGRTTFIIAHRLSTIRNADRIVVIDGGQVMEAGTHQELIATQKSYYRLHNSQYRFAAAGVIAASNTSIETGA